MTTQTPIPCADCDRFIAAQPATVRQALGRLRHFMDDRQTAQGEPHRHVASARAADFEAADAAFRKELAAIERASLCEDLATWLQRRAADDDAVPPGVVRGLAARALVIGETRTHYLGEQGFLWRAEHASDTGAG